MKDMNDKIVFVAGGSSGLGKEISKIVASQGAHVTIFARRQGPLDESKEEILHARRSTSQKVNAVSLDMSNASEVDAILKAQSSLPDVLYCVAGGTPTQCGFITDIEAVDIESCMKNNYYTSAYMAQAMLKIWTQDDRKTEARSPRLRRIVFINSAAAFLGLPGYVAYTSSKCAVRALADTLRMEALRYSGPASVYTIHCAFPSNFITQSFFQEQEKKPEVTKRIEGTVGSVAELEKKFPSAQKVAGQIVEGVARGDFALCDDSMESSLLFANMIGPSPKRGLGILDSILALVIGLFVWPFLRRRYDYMYRRDRYIV